MERYFGAILIALLLLFAQDLFPATPVAAEEAAPQDTSVIPINQPITTESRFSEKLQDQTEVMPQKTVYKDDPDLEIGEEQVENEGKDGKIVRVFKITYFEGEVYQKDLVSSETTPAEDKIIHKGTKIVWRNMNTPDGQVSYFRKLHVWATQYDSHCPGCNDWTATGLHQGKGVIAVDPKVIPLGSKLYIPGYGMAVAGDTGGSIKGNIIDLGFPDAHTSGWMSHFVDIYLL